MSCRKTDSAIPLQLGGLGFLHYNMTVEQQVAHVQAVKEHMLGFVINPPILAPTSSAAELQALKASPSHISHMVLVH